MTPRWESLVQDLRYSLRGLRNRPGFAMAVAVTLALGIGANAAMFAVVDRLLFRPPPFLKHAERAHRVYLYSTHRGKSYAGQSIQYARFRDFQAWTNSFDLIAEFSARDAAVGVGTDAREMRIGAVSATFFSFFDAPPVLGRYFTTAEDTIPIGAPVAVLSYGFWQTRYGGRPDVLGQRLEIGSTVYTIIGVSPRGFVGVWSGEPPAVFVPISAVGAEVGAQLSLLGETWWETYHWTWAGMMVERKPDVSVRQADADLSTAYIRSYEKEIAPDAGQRTPVDIAKPHAVAGSILAERGPNESNEAKVATWLSGVALIVWLIACANVANLLLARALQRRREIAIRLALGVSRLRLASQLFTESALLAILGGTAGLLVAQWGGAVLRALLLPKTAEAQVLTDPRTLVMVGIATLAAGFLTGLAPVFQTRRANLTVDLKSGVREGGLHRSRTRVGLLILQGALSVVLLVGAGLFVRSLNNVRHLSLGFTPDSVLIVGVELRGEKLDSLAQVTLEQRLFAEAPSIPGVTHVSRQLTIPFWDSWNMRLFVTGIDSTDRLGQFYLNAVTPDYFSTMGTRILKGRGITTADVAGAPRVVVVSQSMANTFWPGQEALGQCIRIDRDTMPCTRVVGIAENVKTQSLDTDPGYLYYLSSAQFHPETGGLFIRVHGDPGAFKESVRRHLQALMPGGAYVTVTPLSDVVVEQVRSWELGATMFTVFGLLALTLAAIGLYSVIAYNVAQRTHELGVRVALGAGVRDLAGLVLREGLVLAAIGVVIGGGVALYVSRWVKPLLFDVSPHDPLVFAGVALTLLGAAALASLLPARRAGRVDPMQALRSE